MVRAADDPRPASRRYFNSRASVARQSPEAAANPQTAMMNKLALYVFPLGVVVGGPFLPLAIILYWFSNNIWTFGQQHYVFGKIEKEEEAKKLAARAAGGERAGPGAKPAKPKKADRRRAARSPSAPAARSRARASRRRPRRPSDPATEAVGPTANRRAEAARQPRARDPKKRKR